AADWTDSLRDLVTTIRETNLTIQGNRLGVITKKVTSWAAIIAVPTLVTGYYGMNVPYPGFSHQAGFYTSAIIMIVAASVLYVIFRRKDWLGRAGGGDPAGLTRAAGSRPTRRCWSPPPAGGTPCPAAPGAPRDRRPGSRRPAR